MYETCIDNNFHNHIFLMHKKLEPAYHVFDNEYEMIAIERMTVLKSTRNMQFNNIEVKSSFYISFIKTISGINTTMRYSMYFLTQMYQTTFLFDIDFNIFILLLKLPALQNYKWCALRKGMRRKKGQLKFKKSCFGNVTILMNRKEREREKCKFNELDNFETCIN